MPIQFQCASCGQPIEVDDEHAGKVAACPFCQHVVTVPVTTTLPAAAVSARPADGLAPVWTQAPPAGGVPPPVPAAVPSPATLTLANLALVCAVVMLLCYAITFTVVARVAGPALQRAIAEGAPSNEQIRAFEGALTNAPEMAWIGLLSMGGTLVALVGLVLAMLSLRQHRALARAWVALVLCAGPPLCMCTGFLMNVAGRPGGG